MTFFKSQNHQVKNALLHVIASINYKTYPIIQDLSMVRRNNQPNSSNPPDPVNQNSPQYIQQQLKAIRETKDSYQSYPIMKSLSKKIDEINPRMLQEPSKFIEECLYSFGLHILQTHEDDSNLEVAEQIIISIIEKIISICSMYPKPIRNLEFVAKLLRVKCHLFSYKPSKNKLFGSAQINSKQLTDSFYLICIAATLQQLKKYATRFLQQFTFVDVLELVDIINEIDPNPLNTRQADDLIQAIFQHLVLNFSQKLQQKFVPKDWRNIRVLETKLLQKVVRFTIRNAISKLGVTLAAAMLSHKNTEIIKQGLNLIESYMIDFQKGNITAISEPEFINLINDRHIYSLILSLPVFGEAFSTNELIFQSFSKYNRDQQRRILLLAGSLKYQCKQKSFLQFIKIEFSKPLRDSSKQKFHSYYSDILDPSQLQIQDFFILKILSCEKLTCKLFLQSVRIYIQDYHKCNSQYQKEITDLFEFCLLNQKQYFQQERGDSAGKLFRDIIIDIFEPLNSETIYLMNQIISDEQLWHQVPNKQFCRILASALQRKACFQRIIEIIKLNQKHKSGINFMIKRLLINGEGLQESFTQLFIKGFKQIVQLYPLQERYFNDVLTLFKLKPQLDFQIFRLCFENVNNDYYYSSQTIPSVLQYRQKQKSLLKSPRILRFYKQTLTLMESTDSAQLRNKIGAFIMSLYYNFKQVKMFGVIQNGEQAFNSFLEGNIADFISHAQTDPKDSMKSNMVLGKLCLLQKGLQFTDLLGTTSYNPHENYANQESKVKIKMINHITTGEDVPKQATLQFQENSTLYDILTAFGKLFKCGPEQITPLYLQSIISPVYNLRSIRHLSLTNNPTLIAQKSQINPLKIPTVHQIEQSPELKDNFMQAVAYVFNLFAIENKMGADGCLRYVSAATGIQCTPSDKRLRALLNFDTDNDGIITLEDFIRYYRHKLQVAIFNSVQLEDQLIRLRIRRNFIISSSLSDKNAKEPYSLRHIIMKNPHPIYQILFKLSNHSDQTIADKSRQLLLYLPTLPKVLDKNYLDFSKINDFEICYKLIDVIKYFHKYAEDKQRCEQLMQNVNQQWVHSLLCKYRFSHNIYNIKSYKCLQTITKIIKNSKRQHQQHSQYPLNPFRSTNLQNIKFFDLLLSGSLPLPTQSSRNTTLLSPEQFTQDNILKTSQKISKKERVVQKIIRQSNPVLFQNACSNEMVTNIFKYPVKPVELPLTKRQQQFRNLTHSLPNSSFESLFGQLLVKLNPQEKIKANDHTEKVCELSNDGHQKICEGNMDLKSQNLLLKQNMSQINNCIQQFQGEIAHQIIPQSAKVRIYQLLLKMKNLTNQPQHQAQMLQCKDKVKERHEQEITRKDHCDFQKIHQNEIEEEIRQ